MYTVTTKSEVKILLSECLVAYYAYGLKSCVAAVHSQILIHKVKFPLLEYCTEELFKTIPLKQQIDFCNQIEALKTEGGNVILGKMLQLRLEIDFNESMQKATDYISRADIWYVSDLIGERVFGEALLRYPNISVKKVIALFRNKSNWVQRSLGAGIHYAVKNELPENHVRKLFIVLIRKSNTNDKEIKQGVGWAAKTTAKFHPHLIQEFQTEIHGKKVNPWFVAKIEIGLNRNLNESPND